MERFHRSLQEQCRTILAEVEAHVKQKVKITTEFASWIVRHASRLIYRFAVSKELRTTGYDRTFGRSYRGALVFLFEGVLARIQRRWHMGDNGQSGELAGHLEFGWERLMSQRST